MSATPLVQRPIRSRALLCFCLLTMLAAPSLVRAEGAPPASAINSIGMEMRRIEAGDFLMGSAAGGDFDERPAHWVRIAKPFHIGATEVTNVQYEQFDPKHKELRGERGFSKEDDEAVVFVSWHDAMAFCDWLSKKEEKPYRLPTEAEWEYACRAGTDTLYSTGEELPEVFHRNQKEDWQVTSVSLSVATTPRNPWGLFDMHGNVEEWCLDWYGPYTPGGACDPVGRAWGDFKVTRGGSHGVELPYLRSANRLGTIPQEKNYAIGFRVVQAETPASEPLARAQAPLWARNVSQERCDFSGEPDMAKPYFSGPRQFVKIPKGADGPLFSQHNHCPALTVCPNGDLLAIWYTTRSESGRELAVAAARLRRGAAEWEPAAPFWDAPDRNEHASDIWWDGDGTLWHFNGLASDATWGKLALLLRTSQDNGATWSQPRIVNPYHGLRHMPIAGAFRTREGYMIVVCDAVTGGSGGSAVHISRDGGVTWVDPGEGEPAPKFETGATGAWIAGIHAGVVQRKDGALLAFGRGDTIEGRMPMSVSRDMGETWQYAPSEFPPISGGQRLVFIRLQEGPLLFVSFTGPRAGGGEPMAIVDASGATRLVSGMFAAISEDDGKTWPYKRLVSHDGPDREFGAMDGQPFELGFSTAEPGGYLVARQAPDGVVHLITSMQHYAFNLAWLKTPAPAEPKKATEE